MPARLRDRVSMPRAVPSRFVRHDYGIDDSISRMGYLSNAVLEDTFDAASKSRGKDHELLRNANSAIVSTEMHSTPRGAVISRKARASSVPPVSAKSRVVAASTGYPKVARPQPSIMLVSAPLTNKPVSADYNKPVVLSEREAPWHVRARAGSVQPSGVRVIRAGSVPPRQRPKSVAVDSSIYVEPVGTEGLKAHNPRLIRQLRACSVGPGAAGKENMTPYKAATLGRNQSGRGPSVLSRAMVHDIDDRLKRLVRSASEPRNLDNASAQYVDIPDVKQRALSKYLYAHRGRFGPESRPQRKSLAEFPLVYVPKSGPGPSNRAKAAIIGSKMEAADSGNKKKRPRSLYAAAKYRETRKDPGEENIFYNTSYSGGLQASRPPLPKPTDRKAIRDVDGFTKPRNVMSWQYRVESSLKPDDLIDTPSSFSRMRTQVRDAQEKMDKHRQLLDRYLDKDPLATNSTRNNNTNANTGAASSRSNQ